MLFIPSDDTTFDGCLQNLLTFSRSVRHDVPGSRDRLLPRRKGHEPDAIDDAVTRLLGERALDDTRVAEAIARTETTIRRRGKARVRLQIERAGIAKSTARRAVDEIFDTIDGEAHIEASLKKRLRGRETIADDREFQRLFRYLAGQGFDSDQVMKTLTARRRR